MEKTIEHSGIISHIDGQQVRVRILQASACSACSARSLCTSADSKEKDIDVETPDAAHLSIGQAVTLEGRLSDGLHAAFLAYALPLLLLILILVVMLSLTGSETLAAICALVTLLPYYAVLFFLRDRLRRKFSFRIKGTAYC